MIATKNGITISYTGNGNETVSVYADVNEGLDRSATFTVKTDVQDKSVDVVVNQSGRREIFTDNDFLLSDGGTFNVIKDGLQ